MTIIKKLDNNLIIRHAAPSDAEELAKFNGKIHGDDEWERKGLEEWTLDLINSNHPSVNPDDFIIVEETTSGEIISSSCLISQTWMYEGIQFKVGRPELVATREDYRRQGLVRRQFEILHQWSQARGEITQAITGIPYYYRQFGYEMTLNLGGGRSGYESDVPQLKDNEEEPFNFRLAILEDIPFIMDTYDLGCQRLMVHAMRDRQHWHHELTGKRAFNFDKREIYIIEDLSRTPIGIIGIPPIKWGSNSTLTLFELAPRESWSAVTPSVIRFLWQKGQDLAREQNQKQAMFGFFLGEHHPVYEAAASRFQKTHHPYTFFMRVPDLSVFIHQIKPVLKKRLASSSFANFSGEVTLNFYRSGLKLAFSDGDLIKVDSAEACDPETAAASFPPLVFLHLVFGHRTVDELNHIYPDCYTKNEESKLLLSALFPKKTSWVWPIA